MLKYISQLKKTHPRVYLTAGRVGELKKLVRSNSLAKKYFAFLRKEADTICREAPSTYYILGPRLLHVSRCVIYRVGTLAMTYLLTGETKYARRAERELLAAAKFPDWNPKHFLDTSEMANAFAIGYDWLYEYLSDKSRRTISDALVKHALTPGRECYIEHEKYADPTSGLGWWTNVSHNWNQVCNGGLVAAALAVGDEHPELANYILKMAIKILPSAMKQYVPDGGCEEGPVYWDYATSYTVYALAAMESALGSDFGLSRQKGFSVAVDFPIHAAGPVGDTFNFADAAPRKSRPNPAIFWLGRKFGNQQYVNYEHMLLSDHLGRRNFWIPWAEGGRRCKQIVLNCWPDAFDFVWFGKSKGRFAPRCKNAFFKRINVVTLRSGWDAAATYVAVKGGDNQANHSHLDLGTFVLDALGQRWAMDMGLDSYDLPDYFKSHAGGTRWTYYRLQSRSHNVVLPDDDNQAVDAKAKVVRFDPAGSATIDLSYAYPKKISKWRRKVSIAGRSCLIEDEIVAKKSCELEWGFVTAAKIKLGKSRVTLSQKGKRIAVVNESGDGDFEIASTRQKRPENPNAGTARLVLRKQVCSGQKVRFIVRFAP